MCKIDRDEEKDGNEPQVGYLRCCRSHGSKRKAAIKMCLMRANRVSEDKNKLLIRTSLFGSRNRSSSRFGLVGIGGPGGNAQNCAGTGGHGGSNVICD